MQTKKDLVAQMSEDDIASTFKACSLQDKDKYTDEEADRFRDCRALIQQGKSYEEATQLLQKSAPKVTAKKKRNSRNRPEQSDKRPLDMAELEGTRDELLKAIAGQNDWENAAQAAAEQVVGSFLASFQFHLQRYMSETTQVLQQRHAKSQIETDGNSDYRQRIEARVDRLFGSPKSQKQLSDGESTTS
ncbi:MAG: hypothetical protein AB4040_16410 [Synechococcus sp.]